MPVKEWFKSHQPVVQLYIILVLTVIFFVVELICSHITHSLTLLMDSYHTICNILALIGCILSIKNSSKETGTEPCPKPVDKETTITENAKSCDGNKKLECSDKTPEQTTKSVARSNQETKLRNTFGWARIDVIFMLICGVFLASLSFSVCVEALQTLVHINHFDEMHHPLPVLFIGAAGLLLNGVCYLLVGGYTFHQGSFLYVTESGDVVLNRVVIPELVQQGGRRLSRTRATAGVTVTRQRQGFREMTRDVFGCVLVIICALVIYFVDKHSAKYVDPALSLVSASALMWLSYPYMKESCFILLQTIPASIDIEVITKDLLLHFPDIVNIHDFHVWQLTATKIISTVHIIFQHQEGYMKIMDDIKNYLVENGITQVTIQPEFGAKSASVEKNLQVACLMKCQGEACNLKNCCPSYESLSHPQPKKIKSRSYNLTVGNSLPDLRSIKVIDQEFSKTTECLSTIGKQGV